MQAGWEAGKIRENRRAWEGRRDNEIRPPARVIQKEENEVIRSA